MRHAVLPPLLLACCALPALAVTVSDASGLASELAAAEGGETILLAAGNYGPLDLTGRVYGATVTIASSDPSDRARFTTLDVSDCRHLRFEHIHVAGADDGRRSAGFVNIIGCDDVAFVDGEIHGSVDGSYSIDPSRFVSAYGLEVSGGCSRIRIERNHIHDAEHGAVFFGCDELVVHANRFEDVCCDSMKFGGVSNATISDNHAATRVHPDPDDHVDFIQFQGTARNVEISGNVMLPADFAGKVYQGIFLNDADFVNVVIEDNLIYTNTVNGIFVGSEDGIGGAAAGDGIVIRYNTVLAPPDATIWDNCDIRIPKLAGSYVVEHNVVDRVVIGDGSGTVAHNLELQWERPADPDHYDDIYLNATAGTGATIEDFRPVAGSAGTHEGAWRRIAELLGDGDPPVRTIRIELIGTWGWDISPSAGAVSTAGGVVVFDDLDPADDYLFAPVPGGPG